MLQLPLRIVPHPVVLEMSTHLSARLLYVCLCLPPGLCHPSDTSRACVPQKQAKEGLANQAEAPRPVPRAPHHRSDCLAGWAPPPPTGLSGEPPWCRGERKIRLRVKGGPGLLHLLQGRGQRNSQERRPPPPSLRPPQVPSPLRGQGLPPKEREERDLGQRRAPCVAAAGPSPGAAGRRPHCTR